MVDENSPTNLTDFPEKSNPLPTDEKNATNVPVVRSLSRKSNLILGLNHAVNSFEI